MDGEVDDEEGKLAFLSWFYVAGYFREEFSNWNRYFKERPRCSWSNCDTSSSSNSCREVRNFSVREGQMKFQIFPNENFNFQIQRNLGVSMRILLIIFKLLPRGLQLKYKMWNPNFEFRRKLQFSKSDWHWNLRDNIFIFLYLSTFAFQSWSLYSKSQISNSNCQEFVI